MTEPRASAAVLDQPPVALRPEDVPNVDHLVTEDDTPVDNILSEKQQRLLAACLYGSWGGPGPGRKFLFATNVGLFPALKEPPLVPDGFLSLDVVLAPNWHAKQHRSYFFWEFGKAPELVIEVVSNKEGGEAGEKMRRYARMGVAYYAIYDPDRLIQDEVLRVFELTPARVYQQRSAELLPGVGLGLTLWSGEFEGQSDIWLRWRDEQGRLVLTGAERAREERERAEDLRERAAEECERAEQERARAGQERERAEAERERAEAEKARAEEAGKRADAERERAERLAARLRALGIEPEEPA